MDDASLTRLVNERMNGCVLRVERDIFLFFFFFFFFFFLLFGFTQFRPDCQQPNDTQSLQPFLHHKSLFLRFEFRFFILVVALMDLSLILDSPSHDGIVFDCDIVEFASRVSVAKCGSNFVGGAFGGLKGSILRELQGTAILSIQSIGIFGGSAFFSNLIKI
jgi:hypothetical protein